MNSLKEFIFERTDNYSYNSPDNIHINYKPFHWCDDTAMAFIYSIKLDKFLFSDWGNNHCSILYGYSDDDLKEFDDLYDIANNKNGLYDLRFVTGGSEYKNYNEWKKLNPYFKRFKLGRFWVYEKTLYIAWWDDLTADQMTTFNKSLIQVLKDDEDMEEFNTIYYMNNTGKILKFNPNRKLRAGHANKERKEILKIQQAIHLATQKDKREFFKEFRKYRDEANQKNKYNHTKSKTEAEWRSIRYQGDSLIDNEKNRINE